MSRTMNATLRATAYHEAGHAVARLELKLRFRHVTIRESDDAAGHILFKNMPRSVYEAVEFSTPTDAQLGRIEREMIATLAGEAAERKLRGRRNRVGAGLARYPDGTYGVTPGSDYDTLTDFALRVWGGHEQIGSRWLAYLQARAEELIDRRYDWVEAVVAALLEHERLSEDEVRRLIWETLTAPNRSGREAVT
jgi:ATP-dependent Zn protease